MEMSRRRFHQTLLGVAGGCLAQQTLAQSMVDSPARKLPGLPPIPGPVCPVPLAAAGVNRIEQAELKAIG